MAIIVSGATATASTTGSQGRDAGEILSHLVRECGDFPPDGLLAMQWLNDRYRQVWGYFPWPFTRIEAQFETTAAILSDSVTVTNGSTTVTETTSDSKWDSDVIGRKFRILTGNDFYTITDYSNSNPDAITLDRAYLGSSGTVVDYRIYQDTYSLADDVAYLLGDMVDITNNTPLAPTQLGELNEAFPSRTTIPGNIRTYTIVGRDDNEIYQVQFYPMPDDAVTVRYAYVQEAPYLTAGDSRLLPNMFESMLRHAWKADYWRWKASTKNANGQESGLADREELLFSNELNQMIAREAGNVPPQRLKLASRFVNYRSLRNSKFRSWHARSEMP